MKSQKVIALLLSTALSVSTCIPFGNITALGAEPGTAAEAVEVQEEVSDSEENAESPQEEEISSEAETTEQTAVEEEDDTSDEQEAAVEEIETAETEDTENVTSETGDQVNASADEADTAEAARDEEAPQTSEESDSAAPEQAPAPAAETPAEDQADLNAPAEMDTVKTDAQNAAAISPDADFSDAIEINEGESKTVTIAEENGYVLFSFVPKETQGYAFYSSNREGDPYCYLYDSSHSQIDYSDDASDTNFLIKRVFTAGETYYFQACMYGESTGTYTVHLEKRGLIVDPEGVQYREVSPNTEITLEVNAVSSSEISYQWLLGEDPIEGSASSAYTFVPQKNGTYVCRVSTESGDSEEVSFKITVQNDLRVYPEGSTDSNYRDVPALPNTSVNLNTIVTAENTENLTYRWYIDKGDEQELIEGAASASYTVGPVTSGQYYICSVIDKYGNEERAMFYTYVENHLDAYVINDSGEKVTSSEIYVAPNTNAQLSFSVSADDMTGLTYNWKDEDNNPIEGAGTTSCTVGPITQEKGYTAEVRDRYGNYASVAFYVSPFDYSEAKSINVGDSVQISINENAPYALYTFTPTVTVQCTLYSSGNAADPFVEVFNNSYKRLFYDDDDGGELNFSLEEVFSAGTTYYIRAQAYNNDSDVSYTMHLETSDLIDISQASVTGIVNKTYNGAAQTQAPVVKLGSATLTAGSDYTVSYSNNINAGTAAMTITGKGYCTGTINRTFTIAKAAQSFSVSGSPSVESGKTTKINVAGAKETSTYYFVSSNTAVAAVAGDGTVTGKNPGTASITISTPATANYNAATWTVTINVIKNLKKPGYCHFVKWNNKNYTGCRIAWNRAVGAEGYQTQLCWTNGSHESITYVGPNTLYRDCKVYANHVSLMRVRAFYNFNGQRIYGPWSNMEFITPSPTKLTCKNVSAGKDLKMKVNWPIIYGSNGYNVFVTTNPNGKWSWNQSTAVKANALSAVITKYQGKELKKNTRYYVRIVTRRKFKGVFCSVPMPAKNTYVGSFVIK